MNGIITALPPGVVIPGRSSGNIQKQGYVIIIKALIIRTRGGVFQVKDYSVWLDGKLV